MASLVKTGVSGQRKSTATDSKGASASLVQSTSGVGSADLTVDSVTVTLTREITRELLPTLTNFVSTGVVN